MEGSIVGARSLSNDTRDGARKAVTAQLRRSASGGPANRSWNQRRTLAQMFTVLGDKQGPKTAKVCGFCSTDFSHATRNMPHVRSVGQGNPTRRSRCASIVMCSSLNPGIHVDASSAVRFGLIALISPTSSRASSKRSSAT